MLCGGPVVITVSILKFLISVFAFYKLNLPIILASGIKKLPLINNNKRSIKDCLFEGFIIPELNRLLFSPKMLASL